MIITMPIRNYSDEDFLPFLEMLGRSNPYGNTINADQTRHILFNTIADPYRDLFLAISSEQLVGFGMILRSKNKTINDHSFILRVISGIPDESVLLDELIKLLETSIVESLRKRRSPLVIRSFAFMEQQSIIHALEFNSYTFDCYTARMEMTDYSKLQPPQLAEGFTFVPYNPGVNLDRVIEITEQISNPPLPPGSISRDEFVRKHYSPWFQPELVSLLVHKGTIVGYVWVYINENEGEQHTTAGYISKIGMTPEIRSNDLRLQLVRQAVSTLRQEEATLIHLNISQIRSKEEVSLFAREGFETRHIQFEYYKSWE